MSQPDNFFTIQELSNRLKIAKSTLRFWEKELDGIITPIRTPGGQRRYNFDHILAIQEVKNLRKQGLSIGEIKRKLSYACEGKRVNPAVSPIDFFADQVSELVKKEIKQFFEKEFSNLQRDREYTK